MLATFLALLSSGGFGSIVGLIGGYFNRKLDLQAKSLDHSHELQKMDKDLAFMQAEFAERGKIAVIEGETAESVAGYEALKESYSFANPTGNTKVDMASKLIRPVLTLCFFFFTTYIFYEVSMLLQGNPLTQAELVKLYVTLVEWVLFQAGVSIGWWFAMRPGKTRSI